MYKSANSTLPSGGIGATVNMVTTRPLNIGSTKTSVSLGLVSDTTSEEGGLPVEAAALFATNQGRWAFSVSGSFQERSNREEGTRESNWITTEVMAQSEGYLRVDAATPAYTNNNTRGDGMTFYQEPSSYQIKDNNRTRINGQATFQFQATDDLIATVDYTYSNVDFDAEGVMFGSWLGGWDTLAATINENGAFTDVTVGNRAYDHELIWQTLVNTNKSLGFNLEWLVSDALELSFDAHHSTAAVKGGELNNAIGFTTDIKGVITHNNGGASGINSFAYDTNFGPENYLATGATIRDGFKENEINQVQINGAWTNLNDGLVDSVEFGLSHVRNDFTKIRQIARYNAMGPTAASYDDSLFQRTALGGFMDGFSPNIGTNYYYKIDPARALSAFRANNAGVTDVDGAVCCVAGNVDHNDRVNEELNSVFVQVNMKTEYGFMPIDIVAGMRYERADNESISYYPVPTTLRWDMIAGLVGVNDGSGSVDSPRFGSSSVFLPTLSTSIGVTDNQVVRFSVSRSMARPDLFDLGSQIEIGNRDFFRPTATGGNPDLNPLLSTNLDFSYENYYSETSYFAVNVFRKEIDDFIGSRTVNGQTIGNLTDPSRSAIGLEARACVQEWADAGRPAPGFPGDDGATGDCVSQQAIWAQGWMNDFQHMGWVALGMTAGVDVSGGYPWSDAGADDADCPYDGWWRCEPGYIDGTSADPTAEFELTAPYNMNSGTVTGFEVVLQHLFDGTPFGMQFNYTHISGGDVDVDRRVIGEQFILPGLGDSGNFSVFYEDNKHTVRLALNYRGETVAGFGNYEQPLYVEARQQLDFSYQYRLNDSTTLFVDAANINDETTRLFARHEEMLFLSQDHGPVYKFGFRSNF